MGPVENQFAFLGMVVGGSRKLVLDCQVKKDLDVGRYFFKVLGMNFREGKGLYVLTVFGVALGVASVLSIQIINRNALAAFEGSIVAVSGGADFSVLGRMPAISEEIYPEVLREFGVAAAWPLYRVDVALVGRKDFLLEVLGIDFFAPMRLPWKEKPGDISAPLVCPGWVAVTPSIAETMGWQVGDSVAVSTGSRQVWLVVGALVDIQALSPLASPKLMVMDISQAQSLLGERGKIHQIDVIVSEGMDRTDVMSRLQGSLGESVQVLTSEQRKQQAEVLLSAFRMNLSAMSMISLIVGLFLVTSSTQASLVRRRAEFGLLRSLGATRRQVFWLIVGEVGLVGSFGVLLGLPMGYWAAVANMEVVSGTLTNLYLLEEISSLKFPFWLYGLGVVIGVGGAIVGALIPALDMSRQDSRTLLAPFTLHEKVESIAFPMFGLGLGVLILIGVWFLLWGYGWRPAGFVLGVGLLIGIPMMTPLLIKEVCRRVRIRSFGLSFSLKVLGARFQTTAFAVASLAIAVSMLVGITMMISSFRQTLVVWVDTSIRADIYISPWSWRGRGTDGFLEPELVRVLAVYPGVLAVDKLRTFLGYAGGHRINLAGVEMGLLGGEARFPLLYGDPNQVFQKVREEGAILVGETLARQLKVWDGDSLIVHGLSGKISLPVAGVYTDYSSAGGAAVMDLKTMSLHFGPGPVNSVALYLEPGVDNNRIVDELKIRFSEASLQIRSNRRLREEVFKIFDQTFAVTRLLEGMSLLIAVCGIALMLMVMAREQVSDLAIYVALGASRGQIFGIYVGKGLGMGLLGLGLGLVGGVFLAFILIFVINRAYFGWTIQMYWLWAPVLQKVAIILGAAVVASLYPAFQASRNGTMELSRDDI